MGDISAADQEGVFDVSILGDGKSLEETLCPLNFGTVVKYYPAGNKVIAWDTGQAYTFPADEINSVTYDQQMVDSFIFLTDAAADEPGSHMPAGANTPTRKKRHIASSDGKRWCRTFSAVWRFSERRSQAGETFL